MNVEVPPVNIAKSREFLVQAMIKHTSLETSKQLANHEEKGHS